MASDLHATTKHVGLTLATHFNKAGRCWPGLRELERTTGRKRSTITKHLRLLEAVGFIDVRRGGGSGNPNRYQALIPPESLPANGPRAAALSRGETVPEGAANGARPVQKRSLRGTRNRPEQTREQTTLSRTTKEDAPTTTIDAHSAPTSAWAWRRDEPEIWTDALREARRRGASNVDAYAMKVAQGHLGERSARLEKESAFRTVRAVIEDCTHSCSSNGLVLKSDDAYRCNHDGTVSLLMPAEA